MDNLDPDTCGNVRSPRTSSHPMRLRPLLVLLLVSALPLCAATRGVFNVLDYGAVADGKTKNTAAIGKAIAAAVAVGGGTVHFPAGKYLTGSVHLESNLTLDLDAGARMQSR